MIGVAAKVMWCDVNLQKYGKNTEIFDVKRFSTDENPDSDVGDTVIVTI